jgi:hypothetical protein
MSGWKGLATATATGERAQEEGKQREREEPHSQEGQNMSERKCWEEDGSKVYLVNRSYATSETMLPEPDWVQVHVDYISFSIDSMPERANDAPAQT